MGSLTFKYGTMGCGKTEDLIRLYDYIKRGRSLVFVMKVDPTLKYFGNKDFVIKSRCGREITADYFINDDCELDWTLDSLVTKVNGADTIIMIDEAQFLKPEYIKYLKLISNLSNITVICFGLRLNFKGDLFESSRELLRLSVNRFDLDKLNFHKCKHCANIASHNLKIGGGDGEIEIGGDDMYESVCKDCWEKHNGEDDWDAEAHANKLSMSWDASEELKSSAVEHPNYYKNESGIEVLDLIRHMPWAKGNAIKYIFRAGNKDKSKEVEDLRKAIFCLEDLIKDITSRGE